MNQKTLRYFELFAGIGGFSRGIQEAFKDKDKRESERERSRMPQHTRPQWDSTYGQGESRQSDYDTENGRTIEIPGRRDIQYGRESTDLNGWGRKQFWGKPTCVGFSEIDRYATGIFSLYHKGIKNYGDITTVDVSELPDFDLLTFGWPCQDNSLAGKRAGQGEGTRSGLLAEAVRILKAKKPKYFIAENVPGLFSVNDGYDFYTSIRMLTEAGYDFQWQVLNTSWFRPQNRERIYFVGHIRGGRRPEIFPIEGVSRESDFIQQKTGGEQQGLFCEIPEENGQDGQPESGRGDERRPDSGIIPVVDHHAQACRVYDTDGLSVTINAGGGGMGGKTGLYDIDKRIKRVATYKNPNSEYNSSRAIYDKEGISPTLTAGMGEGGGVTPSVNTSNIRRLTPVECERLQGFPDNYTAKGLIDNNIIDISDTQRYKCIGNAVSVPVVKEVVRRLYR